MYRRNNNKPTNGSTLFEDCLLSDPEFFCSIILKKSDSLKIFCISKESAMDDIPQILRSMQYNEELRYFLSPVSAYCHHQLY